MNELTTTWECPSNIAIVKYWGKRGFQLPANPSLSFTLSLVWPPIVRTKLVKVRQKYYFLHQFCMRFESKNLQEGQRSILV
ncbi:MAG: hypothetical protein AB1583_12200, partial [Bacteroidota bacterium]